MHMGRGYKTMPKTAYVSFVLMELGFSNIWNCISRKATVRFAV